MTDLSTPPALNGRDAKDGADGPDSLASRQVSLVAPAPAQAEFEGTTAEQREVLDAMPARVFLTDVNRRIRYANAVCVKELRLVEDFLPYKVDDLIGSDVKPLFAFLGDVEQVDFYWENHHELPFVGQLMVGDQWADMTISAVYRDGEFAGVMVAWVYVSDRVRAERRLHRVNSMMESSPNAMMFADRKRVINYLNPAAFETLRRIEPYMPITAEQFEGLSVDVMAEGLEETDTEHGRVQVDQLVPENLPVRAQRQIGPETLDILFSAIHGTDGEHIGMMVTFELITEKLRVEEERARAMADSAAMNHVLAALGAATSVGQAIESTLHAVREEFGWAAATAWRLDPEASRLRFAASGGSLRDGVVQVVSGLTFARGDGVPGQIWAQGDVHQAMAADIPAPVRESLGDVSVPSVVGFPVKVGGEVIATLDFFAEQPMALSTQRLETLRNIADLVSQAVARIERDETDRAAAAELAAKVELVLDVVRAIGEGDLTRDITVSGEDAIGQLASGLADVLGTLRGSMSDIGGTADSLAVAADQLSILSQGMGEGAALTSERAASASGSSTQVSSSIQTVATAVEEMTASIREIAKNATEAASVATSAVAVASSAQGTVASLGESSAEIGKVIKVITSIAQQTNLLALNATIEAARAGDAGKGFAVVANEVKELAKETARATEDIGQKIDAIQSDTQGAVTAIREITDVIGRINDIQTTIASAVEQQTATTNEIARSVTDAAAGATGIAADVTQVAAAAEETRHGASNTLQSATDLAEMASQLKARVTRFKF
ncbi:methyl-accepting chemotaxis protein [Nocardioides sp. 616]|uniref:methyl-accepting chemotaxis protein n=1 Tax=Nocardioides sp. 616 TaxID=2268090 RepID=UPI001F0553E3|nr:methyl-accepting chemotaxis protein [Nocardioides sp. 616]